MATTARGIRSNRQTDVAGNILEGCLCLLGKAPGPAGDALAQCARYAREASHIAMFGPPRPGEGGTYTGYLSAARKAARVASKLLRNRGHGSEVARCFRRNLP
mgnify:CR=1 FL=1